MGRLKKDEALDYVCGGIISDRVRDEVRQEMLDHFEDNFERNLAVGMNEYEAEKAALDSFGRLSTLRVRLTKLHSRCPLVKMDSAMSYLFWGFFIVSIKLNIFGIPYVSELIATISNIMIFSALFRMRKANQNLCKALGAHIANIVFSYGYECVTRAFNSVEAINVILVLLLTASGILFYWYLFRGLQNLYNTYAPDDENRKVNFTFPIIGYILFMILSGYLRILSADTAKQKVNIEGGFAIILIIIIIYTLVHIWRTKKVLWDADEEYNIEGRTKRYAKSMACIIAIIVLIPLGAMYIGAHPPVEYQELVINDISDPIVSQKADVIREKMIKLGLPKEISDELPDSEIIRYEGVEKMEIDTNGKPFNYCFFIPKEEDCAPYVRILMCLEPESTKSCDALFINIDSSPGLQRLQGNNDNYVYSGSQDLPKNELFIQSVYTELDKKYSGGIVASKIESGFNNTRAIEFSKNTNSENQHIYYAESFLVESLDTDTLFFNSDYIHRKTWFDYNRADIHTNFGMTSRTEKITDDTSQILFYFDNPYYVRKSKTVEQEG